MSNTEPNFQNEFTLIIRHNPFNLSQPHKYTLLKIIWCDFYTIMLATGKSKIKNIYNQVSLESEWGTRKKAADKQPQVNDFKG